MGIKWLVALKADIKRRLLVAKYPRRFAAAFLEAPTHNPLVLEDCPACHGSGHTCAAEHDQQTLEVCSTCAGAGTNYEIVPYFSNRADPVPVHPDSNGWITCPGCGRRFSLDDRTVWTGLRHIKCGQRLRVE